MDILPDKLRKGRGAVSNRSGRYDLARQATDDGWTRKAEDDTPPRTRLEVDSSRGVLTYNDSPDVPFDRSVNPYRGCEHGCVYCFARPSHAWLGLSPGLDFETRLFAKPNAPELLAAELRKPGYVCRPLALGVMTDAYQPAERETRLTRRILEVLRDFSHPVALITKSALVARDADILAEMAARRLAHVVVTVTTLDRDLARRLEPRAATPPKRIEAIRALNAAGVPVSVNVAPLIPGLTDHEIERILEAAAEAGAVGAGWILLRLPREVEGLFAEWLDAHAPDRKSNVLSLLRDMHGGALYRSAFGTRMRGQGPYAELLARRFDLARRRLGLNRRRDDLDCAQFRPPPAPGDQLSLFG